MKLIDKDALVEWLNGRMLKNEVADTSLCYERADEDYMILKFLNTLEAKEVDLNEEIERCLKQHSMLAVGKKDFTNIAKHFFELGLLQKGE